MKKKVILNSILVSTLLLSGTGVVNAATYKNALQAESKGHIEFIGQDPEVVDPTDPEQPVDPTDPEQPVDPTDPEQPVDPTNPNKGDLVLQYVPELDFGVHKKTTKGMKAKAKLVKVKNKPTSSDDGDNQEAPVEREVVPFVSTWDSRYNRDGWKLTVSRDSFKDIDNGETELPGADVVFSELTYADKDSDFKPIARSGEHTIGTEAVELAKASGKKQGMGSFSLALGTKIGNQTDARENINDEENTYQVTNGVTFKLAERTAVSAKRYQSTFTWNLEPEI